MGCLCFKGTLIRTGNDVNVVVEVSQSKTTLSSSDVVNGVSKSVDVVAADEGSASGEDWLSVVDDVDAVAVVGCW